MTDLSDSICPNVWYSITLIKRHMCCLYKVFFLAIIIYVCFIWVKMYTSLILKLGGGGDSLLLFRFYWGYYMIWFLFFPSATGPYLLFKFKKRRWRTWSGSGKVVHATLWTVSTSILWLDWSIRQHKTVCHNLIW